MARRTRFPMDQEQKNKLNETKKKLCRAIRKSMARQSNSSASAMALRLGTSRACVCRVQSGDADKLTFNQLMRYLVCLEPQFELLVSI